MSKSFKKTFLAIMIASQILFACGVTHQTVSMNQTLEIKDPVFRKFAQITKRITLKVHGNLAEGTYSIRDVPIKVSSHTDFSLAATLPLMGSSTISTKSATGKMSTSLPLTILNVPAPLNIELHEGAGSADVDLSRMLLLFILNSLQGALNDPSLTHSAQPGQRPLSELIESATVDSALIELTEGSTVQFPAVQATIGPKSYLQFSSIQFDKLLNYKGKCGVHLNLSRLQIDDAKAKRKLEFGPTELSLNVQASKDGNLTALSLPAGQHASLHSASANVAANETAFTFTDTAVDLKSCNFKRTLGEEAIDLSLDGDVRGKTVSVESRQKGLGGKLDCENLNGELQFKSDHQKMDCRGKFNLNISSKVNQLGLEGARAAFRNLTFHASEKNIAIDIPECKMVLPSVQFAQIVVNNLPKKRTFQINKLVYEGRKWRYRKLKLVQVTVLNPSLSKLNVTGQDKFTFSATSDVAANGTVERFELHPLTPGQRISWNQRPWSAQAFVKGSGDLTIKFLPGPTLSKSSVQYKLACKMPVPDKLTIDWSSVSNDVLGLAERTLIEQVIKNADYFVAARQIPINVDGQLQPFNPQQHTLEEIKVRSFNLTTTPEGVVITFSANASF